MEGSTLSEPDEGTPPGGVISPLLANIHLDGLDQVMERYAAAPRTCTSHHRESRGQENRPCGLE